MQSICSMLIESWKILMECYIQASITHLLKIIAAAENMNLPCLLNVFAKLYFVHTVMNLSF